MLTCPSLLGGQDHRRESETMLDTTALAQHVPHATTRTRRLRIDVWRAFWALMFVGHLPGLVGGVVQLGYEPSVGLAIRFALLAASQAFFVLKLADVPWLRLGGDRRTWVAVVVCFALLHADVVQRNADEGRVFANVAAAQLIAAIPVLVLLARLTAVPQARGGRVISPRSATVLRAWLDRVLDTCLVPVRQPMLVRAIPDRAPPA